MTKDEMLKLIHQSDVEPKLKSMVYEWVKTAYDHGFEEGMKRAIEVQSRGFEMIAKAIR